MVMDAKTYLAIGELVQAAAHQQGFTGPVQWTVCPNRDPEPDETEPSDACVPVDCGADRSREPEFFYAGNS